MKSSKSIELVLLVGFQIPLAIQAASPHTKDEVKLQSPDQNNLVSESSLLLCVQELCPKLDKSTPELNKKSIQDAVEKTLGNKIKQEIQTSFKDELSEIDDLIDKIEKGNLNKLLSDDPEVKQRQLLALVKSFQIDISTNANADLGTGEFEKKEPLITQKNIENLSTDEVNDLVERLKLGLMTEFKGIGSGEDNFSTYFHLEAMSSMSAGFGFDSPDTLISTLKKLTPNMNLDAAVGLPTNKNQEKAIKAALLNELEVQEKAANSLLAVKEKLPLLFHYLLDDSLKFIRKSKKQLSGSENIQMNIPKDLLNNRTTLSSIAASYLEALPRSNGIPIKEQDWSAFLVKNGYLAKIKEYRAELAKMDASSLKDAYSKAIVRIAHFLGDHPSKFEIDQKLQNFKESLDLSLDKLCLIYTKDTCNKLKNIRNLAIIQGSNRDEVEASLLKLLADNQNEKVPENLEKLKGEMLLNKLANLGSLNVPADEAKSFVSRLGSFSLPEDNKDSVYVNDHLAAYSNPYLFFTSKVLTSNEFETTALHEVGHAVDEGVSLEDPSGQSAKKHKEILSCVVENSNSQVMTERKTKELYADWFASFMTKGRMNNSFCEIIDFVRTKEDSSSLAGVLEKEDEEYPSLIKRSVLEHYYRFEGILPKHCSAYAKEQAWKLKTCL